MNEEQRGHSTERDVGRRLFGERWKIHLWCQPRGTKREEEQKSSTRDRKKFKRDYKKADKQGLN